MKGERSPFISGADPGFGTVGVLVKGFRSISILTGTRSGPLTLGRNLMSGAV
jgi:hypothetical protein